MTQNTVLNDRAHYVSHFSGLVNSKLDHIFWLTQCNNFTTKLGLKVFMPDSRYRLIHSGADC